MEKAPASGYSASRWTGEDSQETNEGRGQTIRPSMTISSFYKLLKTENLEPESGIRDIPDPYFLFDEGP